MHLTASTPSNALALLQHTRLAHLVLLVMQTHKKPCSLRTNWAVFVAKMLLSNLWVSIPIKSKLHAAKGHHRCLALIRPTPGRKGVASTLDSRCHMQFLCGLDRFNIFGFGMFIVTCPLSNGDELTFLFSDEILKRMSLSEPGGFNFEVSQQEMIVYQNYFAFMSMSCLFFSLGCQCPWDSAKDCMNADESHIWFWRINFGYFLHTHVQSFSPATLQENFWLANIVL